MKHKLNTNHKGLSLVETMLVVLIITMLAAITIPNFLRSRKRSQAVEILEDLRWVDTAIEMYALEKAKDSSITPTWADLVVYLKPGTRIYNSKGRDLLGNPIKINPIDTPPKVSDATFSALSDVAPESFWTPFR